MISLKIYYTFVAVGIFTIFSLSSAIPDSAGVVEMTDGLAYGGIPYGSVSGMLAKYQGPLVGPQTPELMSQIPYQSNRIYRGPSSTPVIISPNYRAPGLARRQRGPVQIYRLPSVIAPGVVGTISQIGY